MGDDIRTDSPNEQYKDPFPLDDDASLEKMYFQIRRAIRYIDAENRQCHVQFNHAKKSDDETIRRLRKEVQEYEQMKPQENGIKRAMQTDELQEAYQANKAAKEEESQLKKELAELKKEKMELGKKIITHKKRIGLESVDPSLAMAKIAHKRDATQLEIKHLSYQLGKELDAVAKARDQIINIRFHFEKYGELTKHVEGLLTNVKDDIQNEINKANKNLEIRKGVSKRIDVLQEEYEKVKKQHTSDVRELKVNLQHLKRMREFIATKLDQRHVQKLLEMHAHKVNEDAYSATEDRSIATMENALEAIKRITNEKDINVICDTFEKKDRQSFLLTVRGNELRTENDRMRSEIQATVKANAAIRGDNYEWTKLSQQILQRNDWISDKVSLSLNELEGESVIYKKVIAKVKEDVEDTIKIMSIEKAKFEDLLLKPEYDYKGIVEYLKVLGDACTSAAIQMDSHELKEEMKSNGNKDFNSRTLLKDYTALKFSSEGPPLIKIKPPNASQLEKIQEEQEMKILTKEELKEKAGKTVVAREMLERQPSEEFDLRIKEKGNVKQNKPASNEAP